MLMRYFAIDTARSHPQAVVAGLHPGTVATALSAPFQRRVAPDRLFTPETAATHLLDTLDGLSPQVSGRLFAWDGSPIPF